MKFFVDKFLILISTFLFFGCGAFISNTKKTELDTAELLMNASVRLHWQLVSGGETLDQCGATVIAKNNNKYEVLTALHCVGIYNVKTQKTTLFTTLLPIKFALVFEDSKTTLKKTVNANVIAYGDMAKFEDFAILEIEIDHKINLPPIYKGNEPLKINEPLALVVAPLSEIGNLYLNAYVSKPSIKVEFVLDGVNKQGAVPIQVSGLGIGKGSSGSSVMSIKKNKIVGVVSMSSWNNQGHVTLMMCPISKFNIFYSRYKKGNSKIPNTSDISDITSICEVNTEVCGKLLEDFQSLVNMQKNEHKL